MEPARPTRRNFIAWWMAGILTVFTTLLIAPILLFIVPPPAKGQRKQSIKVTFDKAIDGLEDGDAVKADAPKGTAFVMVDGGGDNAPGDLAFSAYAVKSQGQVTVFAVNCSHLGCSIAINKTAKRFDCPCHGSQFNLDGSVLHGPALHPLSHLNFKKGDQPNQLMIDGLTLGQGVV
jgi:Rieske Fe-S protein